MGGYGLIGVYRVKRPVELRREDPPVFYTVFTHPIQDGLWSHQGPISLSLDHVFIAILLITTVFHNLIGQSQHLK